ncbi:hypothetical protein ACHAW6_000849 [Cyclotella cf. meneghiniana]
MDITGHIYDDPQAGTEDKYFTEEDKMLNYEQYDGDTDYQILKANMPQEYNEETGKLLLPREPWMQDEGVIERMEEMRERFAEEEYMEE